MNRIIIIVNLIAAFFNWSVILNPTVTYETAHVIAASASTLMVVIYLALEFVKDGS